MTTEARERPSVLYHGTQVGIHYSEKHFLSPRYGYKKDEGEPNQPFVMATPNVQTADIFALKTHEVKTILHDIPEPVIIFSGGSVPKSLVGWRYEVPPEGFQEVMRHGKPTNKWYKLENDMSEVAPGVRGVILENPTRVRMQTLITEHSLRVYWHDRYRISDREYTQRIRDAINTGTENDLLAAAEEERWMRDVTNSLKRIYRAKYSHT